MPNFWPRKTAVCGARSSTVFIPGTGHRLRGAFPGGERRRRTVLELVWFFQPRGMVRVLCLLVLPTSAAILTPALSPNLRAVFKALTGSRNGAFGRTAALPRPQAMIIFFDWNDDGRRAPTMSELSRRVENGRVYTVEGTPAIQCRQNSYPVGHYEVLGYGCPDF